LVRIFGYWYSRLPYNKKDERDKNRQLT